MARLFNDASSEYLEIDQAVISDVPCAMVGWFTSNSLLDGQIIIGIADKDVGVRSMGIAARGDFVGDPVHAWSFFGDYRAAESSSGYSANTWHHVAGLWASATDRRVLLDHGSKGTNSQSQTASNLDRSSIGRVGDSSPGNYMSGRIAEAAVWDLSNWPGATGTDKADEFERLVIPALAVGYSPLFFRRGLVAYWPLGGQLSDDNSANETAGDRDIIGGYDMTPFNTPSVADHPPILYPGRRRVVFPAAVAAGTILPQMLQQGLYAGAS